MRIYDAWSDLSLEFEVELSGRSDPFMVEVSGVCQSYGSIDEEGLRYPGCDEMFEFRVFAYNDLVQNYEIDVTDTMSDLENAHINRQALEEWISTMPDE